MMLQAVQFVIVVPALEPARCASYAFSDGWPETAVIVRGSLRGLFPFLVMSSGPDFARLNTACA